MSTTFTVPRSQVGLYNIIDDQPDQIRWTHNAALASWGYAAAQALSLGGWQWRLRKIYIEFENVLAPNNAVSVPTVDPHNPTHALTYYTNLSSSSTRDYIRADLLGTPLLAAAPGYTSYFTGNQGNLLRLFAQTGTGVGIHGKNFNDTANSKVCGSALVVAPVESDPTQDIVVARAYFQPTDQLLKVPGMQIGVTWETPFILPQ